MKLFNRWTLGAGLAAVLLAGLSMFGGSTASAGEIGEVRVDGDIDCTKTAFYEGPAVELGEEVAFEVDCIVDEFATKFGTVTIFDALVIVDVLPDNFTINSADCLVDFLGGGDFGFPASVTGQQVVCVFDVSPLDEDTTIFTLEVEGTFETGPCGDIKNEASASFGGDEEFPAVFIFVECEDIGVTKTASTVTDSTGATVAQGGTIVYTIEVCNEPTGFGEAENVFFFDQLPLGAEFESASSADFDLSWDATSSQVVGTKQSLQPGECATAFITVDTADDAPCDTAFTNVVVAGSGTGNTIDGNPADNEDSVTTVVACPEEDEDEDKDNGGPSVGTGNSGLIAGESSVAGWQLALLSLLIVGSLSGAYVGYRRVR